MRRLAHFAVAITCCALALAGLGSPGVYAAGTLALSKMTGPPTTVLTASGSGFRAYEGIVIDVNTTQVGSTTANGLGAFSKGITVPATAQPGNHVVKAVGQSSGIAAQATFLVRTDWAEFGFSPSARSFNPYENTVGTNNVSSLRLAWTGPVTEYYNPPVVANGLAYIGDSFNYPPVIKVFRASGCGAAICPPLWMTTKGAGNGSVAVVNGVLYAASDRLYAYKAAGCGSSRCPPVWSSTAPSSLADFGSPTVQGGVVYVTADKLYAFRAAGCGAATCSPLWTASIGQFPSSAAVANGVVYVGAMNATSHAKLYAFSTSGGLLWTATTGDLHTGFNTPAVAYGLVYASQESKVYAYQASGCGASSCAPLWRAATGDCPGCSPAVASGIVFVNGYRHLAAFKASGCGTATCSPLWIGSRSDGYGSPSVADGVVYVGGDSPLYAYRASGCGTATCLPLWSWAGDGVNDYASSPVIADGILYTRQTKGLEALKLP